MQLRQQGIALIAALFTVVIVFGLISLMLTRSVNEIKHSGDDAAITQSLLLARGAANIGNALLDKDIRAALNAIVKVEADSSQRWSFGEGVGDQPTASSVVTSLNSVAEDLQEDADALICNETLAPEHATGNLRITIYFTDEACGRELPSKVKLPSGRFVAGTARSSKVENFQTYAIPYVIVAQGGLGVDETGENKYQRNIVLQGEYRFDVGSASFSHYAYFTNSESSSGDNNRIYFTNATMIDGPVHTNSHFSFAYDPWFGGSVSSSGCSEIKSDGSACEADKTQAGAYFYGEEVCTKYEWRSFEYRGRTYWYQACVEESSFISNSAMNPDSSRPSYENASPEFSLDGVAWEAEFQALPQNAQDQELVAKGKQKTVLGVIIPRPDRGLHFNNDLHSLTLEARDEDGNPLTRNSQGKWEPEAKYQYITACKNASNCDVYRTYETTDASTGDKIVKLEKLHNSGSHWDTTPDGDSKPFNGMIYVKGEIHRLTGPERSDANDPDTAAPAIANFSGITVTAEQDTRITGDLKYEDPPCTGRPTRDTNRDVTPATCDNLGAQNVLGIFSPTGKVIVGNNNSNASKNAPDNVHVHASIMTSQKSIEVEDWHTGSPRGEFVLLGGMIQNNRGIFGQFSGTSQTTGYSRVYTYDRRFKEGFAPPFFPTTTSDEVKDVRYLSFGQREQIF